MSKLLQDITKELPQCTPPKWLPVNTMYLCVMGSQAYGVADQDSDYDVYGFCVPPKETLFKPLNECIPYFDKLNTFETWQQHHLEYKEKDYDFVVHNITKFFLLTMHNNPNMVDALFVPRKCILHSTPMSEYVREHRHQFLHKGCFQKFKGYAYSQMHKMNIKKPVVGSKRYDSIVKHGYCVKFAYHIVRLLNECEQILTTGTLVLDQNNEVLKAIRRGDWSQTRVIDYFTRKEIMLEEMYKDSTLQYSPDKDAIREILFKCLEMHYDFSELKTIHSNADKTLKKIQDILDA